jgi:hypothetical protein
VCYTHSEVQGTNLVKRLPATKIWFFPTASIPIPFIRLAKKGLHVTKPA